jgi:outer membrane protein assembly factor BamB
LAIDFCFHFVFNIDRVTEYGKGDLLDSQEKEELIMRRIGLPLALALLVLCSGFGVSQNPPKVKETKQPPPVKTEPEDTSKEDLKVLREAGLKGEGPDLLEFFRKRTYKQPDPKQLDLLIKQLGDDDFDIREKAYLTLRDMGASAMTAIKQGEANPDLEVKKRSNDLRQRIENRTEQLIQGAAARMLAKYKLTGTAEVLMGFLPFATDTQVVDEVSKALGAVAAKDANDQPLLVKALSDTIPVKRGAAGEALIRAGIKADFPLVKKLLQDKDSSVRYRVSLAMLRVQDKDVLPVIIELLGEVPTNQLWQLEEPLHILAGEKAPTVSPGNDDTSRKNYVAAWRKWLTDNEKTIDMAKLTAENALIGYTLIVQQNNIFIPGKGQVGEVYELDANKKTVRWKFDVTTYPVDAQMISPTRVLIAEYNGVRVTERDTKGAILWEYQCGGNPFAVQRLPNGNTFIAMQGRLVEVDRNKNEVWSYQHPQHNIFRARRLPNGEVAFITNLGIQATYTRMDPKNQRIVKTFNIAQVSTLFGNFEVLPNGHVVVPHFNQHRVIEYDQDGKQVGNPLTPQWPSSAVRLPNGNTLITSQNLRQVSEYAPNGTQVWSYTTNGNVFVARRR